MYSPNLTTQLPTTSLQNPIESSLHSLLTIPNMFTVHTLYLSLQAVSNILLFKLLTAKKFQNQFYLEV